MAPGIAEPPNDPHWRAARGCPPEARTTWPSAPWGFGRGANLAARARHPPRPDWDRDVPTQGFLTGEASTPEPSARAVMVLEGIIL